MEQSAVLTEISKYIMDENMNDDVLRKCFLMQVMKEWDEILFQYYQLGVGYLWKRNRGTFLWHQNVALNIHNSAKTFW